MPIFARTKMVIEDNCMSMGIGSPSYTKSRVKFNYSGPNPHKAYYQTKKLIHQVFGIPEEAIQERNFSWDRSKPEEKLSTTLVFVKPLDKFSFIYGEVDISGSFRKSEVFETEGSLSIEIETKVRTEYPQDTFWERSIFYELLRVAWHKIFYTSKRVKYIEECRRLTQTFYDAIRQFLDLLHTSK